MIKSKIDVQLNSTRLLAGQRLSAATTNSRVANITRASWYKVKGLIGFAPEVKGTFTLADYNKDGESCLGLKVDQGHKMMIRNKKGRVVFRSDSSENSVRSLVLPSGEYSYLVQV